MPESTTGLVGSRWLSGATLSTGSAVAGSDLLPLSRVGSMFHKGYEGD